MSNFTINYSVSPWLMLLLIPIIALTLFPYFKLAKRYRRNRNRIISIVLHTIIAVLAVSVLAGATFSYDIQNKENEVILLVDCSNSGNETVDIKDEYIQAILDESGSKFKIGIVTFGKDCYYAAELSNDVEYVYNSYSESVSSHPVDNRATDLSSALYFAKSKFSLPETAKIVVISDGVQTDGNAMSAIKAVVADGTKVDTILVPNELHDEVEIIDAILPDANLSVDNPFDIRLTIQSSIEYVNPTIKIYENGELKYNEKSAFTLHKGVQTIDIPQYTFEESNEALRQLEFEIEVEGDTLSENNRYFTYVYLQKFNKVLLLESISGEADAFEEMLLATEGEFEVASFNVNSLPESFPKTLEELSEYDQIVLLNISNDDLRSSDMPSGFDTLLNRYAGELGGGVLVVGGSEAGTEEIGAPVAHAFNRDDFNRAKELGNTAFADMLPVEVADYRPPLGIEFVIDCSWSMDGEIIEYAKDAARICIESLDDHDYVGILGFGDKYIEYLPVTLAQSIKERAKQVIDNIKIGEVEGVSGATRFIPPLDYAGKALANIPNVDRRHIILITDGEPYETLNGTSSEFGSYGPIVEANFRSGVTLSIIGIGTSNSSDMKTAAERLGGGNYIAIEDSNVQNIIPTVRNELKETILGEVTYIPESYTPKVGTLTSIFKNVDIDKIPSLGGYFGTKVKPNVDVALRAEYGAPLYAQWKYGKGKVGAFMCSLNGNNWSDKFITDDVGVQILKNIVNDLMPTSDITLTDIKANLVEDNYTTRVNVFASLEEGQKIKVTVTKSDNDLTIDTFETFEGSDRATFVLEEPGIYKIAIQKLDSFNMPISGSYYELYRTFSYSKEYDVFVDEGEIARFMSDIAANGNGAVITDAAQIFAEYETDIHKTFDPTLTFIIIAIVLFLLDVAVRKFKFKWPHEIVRDYKEKKRLGGDANR